MIGRENRRNDPAIRGENQSTAEVWSNRFGGPSAVSAPPMSVNSGANGGMRCLCVRADSNGAKREA